MLIKSINNKQIFVCHHERKIHYKYKFCQFAKKKSNAFQKDVICEIDFTSHALKIVFIGFTCCWKLSFAIKTFAVR